MKHLLVFVYSVYMCTCTYVLIQISPAYIGDQARKTRLTCTCMYTS